MTKKRQSSLIIKAIMLLLALIIMIFVASLAWFVPPDHPVEATGLSVSAKSGKQFKIALGFSSSVSNYEYVVTEFGDYIDLSNIVTPSGTFNILQDFSPLDVTGDGVTLVRPYMQQGNKDIDRNVGSYTSVTPNKEYLSFDLYFMSNEVCQVKLDSETFVKGLIEENGGSLVLEEHPDGHASALTDNEYINNRLSKNGWYSRDAIVGAIRTSFVNYSECIIGEDNTSLDTTPRVLWLPRPDIHLNEKNDGLWDLSLGLTEETSPLETFGDITANTYKHHYYKYTVGADNTVTGADYIYDATVTDPNGQIICDVNKTNNNKDYYGKTKVNIWIEGCDAEARRTMSGGQFVIKFDFAGV